MYGLTSLYHFCELVGTGIYVDIPWVAFEWTLGPLMRPLQQNSIRLSDC